jgi:hypothetical protein
LLAKSGDPQAAAAEWAGALADLRAYFLAEPAAFGALMGQILISYVDHCQTYGFVPSADLDINLLFERLEQTGFLADRHQEVNPENS